MKLPNAQQAIIPEAKLRDCLLSPVHPVGRHKSAFFAALGYIAKGWSHSEYDLRDQRLTCDCEFGEATEHGQKYEIHTPLTGPNGRQADVLSVLILRHEEHVPRVVSAMPA